ncbi:FAD-binding domain protein [Ceratobasidium sp. AG-Ba]|nr:FAD-binding domain protein [Ceratobasidium sp. AG-Ba]
MVVLLPATVAALLATSVVDASPSCLRAKTSSSKVLDPLSPFYLSEKLAYWSSTCVLTPKCIFTPTSALDVSTAIKVLVASNCEFAVRGGGHTPNPGWAGTSNGVLISLSKLDTIRFGEDTSSVHIGAGNRWGDVYAGTGKRGVTVAGGRISPVGVSGFLLGGGLSYLMHEKGFAANSVLSYEIVLANGTVATASSTSHPDLFKALKGGSGNFGIVTQFQLQTYPIHNVYAGNLYYTPQQYNSLFPAIEAYARTGVESAPKSHIISAWVNVPSRLLDMATFYAFYSDPVASPPPGIQPFFDIPTIQNTVKVKTVKEAADELTVGTINGLRQVANLSMDRLVV